MKRTWLSLLVLMTIMILPTLSTAQEDAVGWVDTLTAEINKIDDNNWTVTFSYDSDATIIGISVPFKISAGLNKIVADSIKYEDRVSSFVYKTMRADSAIQCVTLGLIANVDGSGRINMLPGKGDFATVYISSIEDKPIEALTIDTTTTYPNNTLMTAAALIQGTAPDTTRLEHAQQKIIPVFVISKPKILESR